MTANFATQRRHKRGDDDADDSTVTTRFPYSMKWWIPHDPVIRPWKQVRPDPGQPRPDPVRRNAGHEHDDDHRNE